MSTQQATEKGYIASIVLDEHSVLRRSPQVEHERAVAISDLLDENVFCPTDVPPQPFHVQVGIAENRLHLTVSAFCGKQKGQEFCHFSLPIAPFRAIVRDYFLICESYFEVIKQGNVSRIEAIDMGRRGLHNEGSTLLASLLSEKVLLDANTARRLFTLLCVLHIKQV